jgi:exopolysaccharide production protein ExoZ
MQSAVPLPAFGASVAEAGRAAAAPAIAASGPPAPDPPKTPILGNVQALRAIAVLMVFAVHVGNPFGFEPRYLAGDPLMGWVNLPGQVGVDLFFVISGLIMTVTTWNVVGGGRDSRRFLMRRLKRIYPIYWVVSLLVLAVFLVRPEIVNSHSSHPPDVLASFLLLPQAGLPLLAVGWTLTYEMYFYILFGLALLCGRRRLPWILGAWALVTFALAVAFEGSSVPTLNLLANPLLLEFLMGVVVGHLVMTRRPVAPGWMLAAGTVLMGVGVWFASGIDPSALDAWFRTVAIGPPAALIVLGAIGLERRKQYIAPRVLQYLGDASYSIYLWHTLLLVAAGRVVVAVMPGAENLHLVLLIAVSLAVLGACIVLYELVERPLLRLVNRRRAPRAERVAA